MGSLGGKISLVNKRIKRNGISPPTPHLSAFFARISGFPFANAKSEEWPTLQTENANNEVDSAMHVPKKEKI